jgi:hypothetical protein
MNAKWILALPLAICVIAFSCSKDTADPPVDPKDSVVASNVHLSQGLLAYYPFNGNVNDESGNGNNGTIFNNAVIVADKNGKPQSALSVDGSNGVIVSNGAKLINADSMTISLDVMARALGRQVYVSTINFNTGNGLGYLVGASVPGDTRNVFGVARSGYDCDVHYTDNANNVLGISIEKEAWYTMVVTFKAGTLEMYMNGQRVGTATVQSPKINICQNTNFIIGNWWQNDLAGLNGKIDNVRVYNRVLNADEIKALNN